MTPWRSAGFDTQRPTPEAGNVFFLGGSLHGQIMEEPESFCQIYRHAVRLDSEIVIETYRREEFRVGRNQRRMFFYVHSDESTDFLLIKALTELCIYKREAGIL